MLEQWRKYDTNRVLTFCATLNGTELTSLIPPWRGTEERGVEGDTFENHFGTGSLKFASYINIGIAYCFTVVAFATSKSFSPYF